MKTISRRKVIERVLSDLEGMLGGEGWNDPRLVRVVAQWIPWPAPWEDQTLNISAIVDALLDQSFDPRDLV